MSSQNEIVKLNIGGTVFQSTKSTLTKFDGFFKTMLETDVPVGKGSSGEIFIDRDPTHFRFILNFMRDGDVDLPESEKEVKEISREAQYYLLESLVKLCNLSAQKWTRRDFDSNFFKVLKDDGDVVQAVANSEIPVLIILLKTLGNEKIYWITEISEWKLFIQKHEGKWNIFFKANSKNELDWKFYSNKKYHLQSGREECPKYRTREYSNECYNSKTLFDHLEFHMNIFLDAINGH